MMLLVRDLTVRYGQFTAINGLSFTVDEGEWLMIAGPNGAGKSTALSAIAQSETYTGDVLINGENIKKLKPSERARRVGVLSQNNFVGYGFSVEEVVELGLYSVNSTQVRTPNNTQARVRGLAYKKGGRAQNNMSDRASGHSYQGCGTDPLTDALRLVGMEEQRAQSVLTLSGGELQRTFLAQVLVQDPSLLLLDEPTNHLDLIYQKQIFKLVSEWLKTPGRAVVSVVHDLSLAKKYGTKAILMDRGTIRAQGAAREILNKENLDAVYRMDVYEWMHDLHRVWED